MYGNPPEAEWGLQLGGGEASSSFGYGAWYPAAAYDPRPEAAPAAFVAWRYYVSLALARAAHRRFLWLQVAH